MSRFMMLFFALILAWGTSMVDAGPQPASVTLPLSDYLALKQRVERLDRERLAPAPEPVAELIAQTAAVRVTGGIAEITATYTVERRGEPAPAALLPFSGMAEHAAVEPAGGAALHRAVGGVSLVAPRPGSYTVTVRGRRPLEEAGGVYRLPLDLALAPVATVDLDLPAELGWSCEGAIVTGDTLAGDRRRVRLAPQPGREHVVELRRRRLGGAQQQVLARAAVVTVAALAADGLRRHEVVLYEVERGSLGTFELALPPTPAVTRVATDEGDAVPRVAGGRLTVARRQRLAGTGHLALSFRPQPLPAGGSVALPPIEPEVPARERYLVVAASLAAEVEPLPAAAWEQVDLEDLSAELRDAIAALEPSSVWRRTEAVGEPRLRIAALPPAKTVGSVIERRETTTVLTTDGSLVHRDRFTLRQAAGVLELSLPTGATLWSAQVDGLAVRPLERGASVAVPLSFQTEGQTIVEVVTVEERALERRRSRLGFAVPAVAVPVLAHTWRLLLPEGHRYRLAASDLRRVTSAGSRAFAAASVRPSFEPSGDASSAIRGTVTFQEDGSGLPGVLVTALRDGGESRQAVTSDTGSFTFSGLPAGSYRVRAELEGFSPVEVDVNLPEGRAARFDIPLPILEMEETIIVTSEARGWTSSGTNRYELERRAGAAAAARAHDQRAAAARELGSLRRGLSGGVKPLAVAIPESGKLLMLAGALPPASVRVELEVKSRG